MTKKLATLIIGILVFIYGTPVLAANTSGGGQNGGTSQQTQQQTAVSNQGTTQQIQTQINTISPTGMKVQNQATTQTKIQTQSGSSSTGAQVQNQNQVQTQNQGEDQSLQVSTQEQENLEAGNGQTSQGNAQRTSGSQQVLLSIDAVTEKLDSILTVTMVKGSPGEKIQTLVQAQSEAQKTVKTELQKLDMRQGLMKSLIGPDYKAMKIMTQQMEQNQLRIQELEQLKIELANQGDITMVEEAIQTLTDQNIALQDKISLEEQTNSLLGWLFKFFAR